MASQAILFAQFAVTQQHAERVSTGVRCEKSYRVDTLGRHIYRLDLVHWRCHRRRYHCLYSDIPRTSIIALSVQDK